MDARRTTVEDDLTFFDKDPFGEEILASLHQRYQTQANPNSADPHRNRVICLQRQCAKEVGQIQSAEDATADAAATDAHNHFHMTLFEEMTRSYHFLLLLQHRRFLSAMETLLHHDYYTACAHDEAVRNLTEEQRRCEAQCVRLQHLCTTHEGEVQQLKRQQELSNEKEKVLLEHVQVLEEQVRQAANEKAKLHEALQQEAAQRTRLLQECQVREDEVKQHGEEEKAYMLGEVTLLRRELDERMRHDARRELTVAVQEEELREVKQLLLLLHDVCSAAKAADAASEEIDEQETDVDNVHSSPLFRNVNVDHTTDFMFLADPTTSKISKLGCNKSNRLLKDPYAESKKLVDDILLHLRRNTVEVCCINRCGEAMEEYLFRDAAERHQIIAQIAERQRTATGTHLSAPCEAEGPLVSRQFVQVMGNLLTQLQQYKSRMHQKADIIRQKAQDDKQNGGLRKNILCDFSGRTYHQMTYQTCFQPLEKQLDTILQYVEGIIEGQSETRTDPSKRIHKTGVNA